MEGIGHAEVRESHAAVVFFVGDRAYKLKKPVNLGFLDFRSREAREAVCHREVELNRRLAPDVYLGVADVAGPDGKVCDHLVVMRRMPAERRLSALICAGTPVVSEVQRLARLMATFHAAARRGPEISAAGTAEALLGRWTDTFVQLRRFHGGVLDADVANAVERLVRDFVTGRKPLFDARVTDGRIVDGHADLLADDIFCLDDGPRVLDCLEFDDRLRYVDVLDDVAFLAMDLEHLGATEAALDLLDQYAEFSGDHAAAALREHFMAYRAFVRAKVACLRHEQGDLAAARDVSSYADLALRHLRDGVVRLILVGGMPTRPPAECCRTRGRGRWPTAAPPEALTSIPVGSLLSSDLQPYAGRVLRPVLAARRSWFMLAAADRNVERQAAFARAPGRASGPWAERSLCTARAGTGDHGQERDQGYTVVLAESTPAIRRWRWVMRARDIMTSPVFVIERNASAESAAELMTAKSVTALPVVDSDGRLVGMVSEGDLLWHRVPPEPTAEPHRYPDTDPTHRPAMVVDVMSKYPMATTPLADVAEVAELMLNHDVRSMPVLDGDRIVGIISRRDILRAMVRSDDMLRVDAQARLDEYADGQRRWTVGVTGGVATVVGEYTDDSERAVVEILVRTVPGVARVKSSER